MLDSLHPTADNAKRKARATTPRDGTVVDELGGDDSAAAGGCAGDDHDVEPERPFRGGAQSTLRLAGSSVRLEVGCPFPIWGGDIRATDWHDEQVDDDGASDRAARDGGRTP